MIVIIFNNNLLNIIFENIQYVDLADQVLSESLPCGLQIFWAIKWNNVAANSTKTGLKTDSEF